jgi:predicted RecB family nuclease
MVGEIERARKEPQRSKLNTAVYNQNLADQIEVLERIKIAVMESGVKYGI